MSETKSQNIPVGVAILAIVEYVAAAFYLIVGLITFSRSDIAFRMINNGNAFSGGYPLLGIILILVGAIHLALGIGLWDGKYWAYLWVVIVSILYLVLGIIALVMIGRVNYISLVLNAVVLVYLLASTRAKMYLR